MKFFAEGLPRLGIINVYVELDSIPNESTNLLTTAGDINVVLQHNANEVIIPIPFPASSTETLNFPSKNVIASFRIQTVRSNTNEEPQQLVSADDIQKQWSQGAILSCRVCHRQLLTSPQIRWKDLPSDSWIEFSDYWLCHSGSIHSHSHSHQSQVPVFPHVKSRPETVLLGLTSLLLHPNDPQNIMIKVPTPNP
jgi:hypothetical protein